MPLRTKLVEFFAPHPDVDPDRENVGQGDRLEL
jgi:hypothetical protein